MLFERYTKSPDETSWQALTYFNFYRFLLAFLFVSLYWVGQLPPPLGTHDRVLFALSSHTYLLLSIIFIFFIQLKKPRYRLQVAVQIFTDILIIISLMYASAGLNSGFGMLLIIAVAGGTLLSPGRLGILFAAVASLSVLGHEGYAHLLPEFPAANYTHAGFLGITFFVTAIIFLELSRRVDESRALAKRQAADIENLSQLNENIVQRMRSGIIVVDDACGIRLANSAAKNLLALKDEYPDASLETVSPELYRGLKSWLNGNGEGTTVFSHPQGYGDIQASFSRLSIEGNYQLLIFLEDMSSLVQRAQQIKLASLGRLTASIAHEIRNPLAAISHAGQLLSESDSLNSGDRRLTSIIDEHSHRVNRIVENVMSISRRNRALPVSIELQEWLQSIVDEFIQTNQLQPSDIRVHAPAHGVHARLDPEQMRQVLLNLLENGIRYSREHPLVEITVSKTDESERPLIDIVDHGNGIEPGDAEQLFEPFFTTSDKGSGLGLYIARELCESNQATLTLHENTGSGCCFRITFSHPEKQHSLN
ncbi:MAG: ATP-binding protein [Gammaproteobacteria bacterium]